MTRICYGNIKNFFKSTAGLCQCVFNQIQLNTIYLQDIAIIQSFYGIDLNRITATTNALRAMLQSTIKPQDWIFVEAQCNEKLCCFKWLEAYGIKHVYIHISDKQDGLFLKTPLWNIGIQKTSCKRLCFIDSDVMFCNSDWLSEVEQKFNDGIDVMSLHGQSYYENQFIEKEFDNSIGFNHKNNILEDGKNTGHYGFTIGMTRDFYDKFGGFNCTYILDDLDYWSEIVGNDYIKKQNDWQLFNTLKSGYNIKIGSTDEVICHCDHGEINTRKYRQLTDIARNRIHNWSDIILYDPLIPENLPVWNSQTSIGRILQNAVKSCKNDLMDNKSGDDLYFENAKQIFGEFDDNDRLVIYTCLNIDGSFKYTKQLLESFYEKLVNNCRFSFSFICFSNTDLENIDRIPLSNEYIKNLDFLEIFRKDVEFPENTNILYLPIDFKFDSQFEVFKCQNDDITIDRINNILYFMYTKETVYKFRNSSKIGRNIEEFLYFNSISYVPGSKYIHKLNNI